MPQQKTITVYKFSELSDRAKQYAKQWHQDIMGFSWNVEYIASLEALAQHFGGRIWDYSYLWDKSGPSFVEFSFDDDNANVEEVNTKLEELGRYDKETLRGFGDCKLTGFCADENAIDGFRIAWMRDGYRSMDNLMQAAFRSWLSAAQAEFDDQYTDSQFSEQCDANEYLFHENGELFS